MHEVQKQAIRTRPLSAAGSAISVLPRSFLVPALGKVRSKAVALVEDMR